MDCAVLDFNRVALNANNSLDEVIVCDDPAARGDPVKDHDIASMNVVESIAELVYKNPIVLKESGFHGWATDIKLLKDINAHQKCGSESDGDNDDPISKDAPWRSPWFFIGLQFVHIDDLFVHEASNLVADAKSLTPNQNGVLLGPVETRRYPDVRVLWGYPIKGQAMVAGRQLDEGTSQMKVWIDQDLCTGDGLCEEIAPDVFTLLDDGLAYVKEGDKVFATAKGNAQGADGLANFADNRLDAVVESAEECPGECIFIEA